MKHVLQLSCILIMLLSVELASAMPAAEFKSLRRAVDKASFSSGKLDLIRLAVGRNTFSCAQVKVLITPISFSRDKHKALRLLAPKIENHDKSFLILEAFTFSSDKKKASVVLRQARENAERAAARERARQEAAREAARQQAAREAARQEAVKEAARQAAVKEKARQEAAKEKARQQTAIEKARQEGAAMERARQATARRARQPYAVGHRSPNNGGLGHSGQRRGGAGFGREPSAHRGAVKPLSAATSWAAEGITHVTNVWPRAAMARITKILNGDASTRIKLARLGAMVERRDEGLSAAQVLRILEAFNSSGDMVDAIRVMEPKILAMPAAMLKSVLVRYPSMKDRLTVLRALKDTILDPENRKVILRAFPRRRDNRKASKILSISRARSALYGTIRGHHVVFVIDCSGSMKASVFRARGRSVNRLDYVRYELSRAIRSLPRGTTFNIVVFAGGVLRWKPNGAMVSPAAIKAADAFMANQRPEGGTNIWDALKTALSERGVDEIHFLTDGTPTSGPVIGHRAVLSRFRELLPRGTNVRINGAAMLMGHNPGDQKAKSAELVCAMAHETHGTCRVFK